MSVFDVTGPGPGPGKYRLPPVVGYPQHDFTKWRNPQYTIPRKYYSVLNQKSERVPFANLSGLTRFGRVTTPAYSLQFKHSRAQSPSASFTTQESRRGSANIVESRRGSAKIVDSRRGSAKTFESRRGSASKERSKKKG